MKVSLVLTTYNGEKYITQQLDSIYQQTLRPDEVLIFDDRSTDRTPELVNAFIRDHGLAAWHFTVNETNKGWRRNCMEGLGAASGDIVFLADQDDVWLPRKIERMRRAMEENSAIRLLACGYQAFYDDTLPTFEEGEYVEPVKKELYPKLFSIPSPGCTYCTRRELIEEAGAYWTEDAPHDSLLWRLALLGDALYLYPQKLIFWRKHRDSAWSLEGARNKNLANRIRWTAFAEGQIERMRSYLAQRGSSSPEKERVLAANSRWIGLRRELFQKKKAAAACRLLGYLKYYSSFRQYLGDVYLTFLKRE